MPTTSFASLVIAALIGCLTVVLVAPSVEGQRSVPEESALSPHNESDSSFRVVNRPANQYSSCGAAVALLQGEEQHFTSPKFPQNYPPNSRCTWQFQAEHSGVELVLNCPEFLLTPVQLCNKYEDFLLVDTSGGHGAWFCGGVGPQNIQSSFLRVTFWSNSEGARKGFSCHVAATAGPVSGVHSGSGGGGSGSHSSGVNAVIPLHQVHPIHAGNNLQPNSGSQVCACGQRNMFGSKKRARSRESQDLLINSEPLDSIEATTPTCVDGDIVPSDSQTLGNTSNNCIPSSGRSPADLRTNGVPLDRQLQLDPLSPYSRGALTPLPWSRVVGGVATSPHEYPWLALMEYPHRTGVHCAGALISSRHVITAAHCNRHFAGLLSVVLGEHDRHITGETHHTLRLSARTFLTHPLFNASTNDNDIAIITLDQDIDLDQVAPFIAPICPPNPAHHYESEDTFIAGWGTTSEKDQLGSRVPLAATVRTITLAECRRLYPDSSITVNMLCALGDRADTCQNDSGGPLMALYRGNRHVLAGVVSWGIGCARPRFPGVYTRVANYVQWIVDNTRGAKTCPPSRSSRAWN